MFYLKCESFNEFISSTYITHIGKKCVKCISFKKKKKIKILSLKIIYSTLMSVMYKDDNGCY